jgi:hypothetical protein
MFKTACPKRQAAMNPDYMTLTYLHRSNHVPHLLMTISATSAGVGIGSLIGGEWIAASGIAIGVATAVANFIFWAYTQWGRASRESYAAWRDQAAAALIADALAAAKAKILVDDARAAELVAVALAVAKSRLLLDDAAARAVTHAAPGLVPDTRPSG